MGRQAYAIGGGIIGAAVAFWATGGTATWQGYEAGFAAGAAIGGVVGSYVDPILIQGNKIGDSQFQVAAEGGARALMFGRCCVTATCVVARGNRKVVKTKSSNGKGSSGSTVNETVTWTFAIGLGEAIVGGSIARIWQDETLVYDVTSAQGISTADNEKFAAKFRFYDGAEDQLPDADLQVFLGADTPYFRGTAYVVFPNFDLTVTGERIPTFKFDVTNANLALLLEDLGWSIPDPLHAVASSQSVTLPGTTGAVSHYDMYLTGHMETCDYTDSVVNVTANGRIITANSAAQHSGDANNVYKIVISNPPKTYYVNKLLPGDTMGAGHVSLINPDGSDAWKFTVAIADNATVTFSVDPVDGLAYAPYGPQFGSVHVVGSNSDPSSDSVVIELGSFVSQVCQLAGIDPADLDVTQLDHGIAGVCIQQTVSGADAINSCVQPFFADPCERDGVLAWVKRGGSVLRTLTIDDLIEEPEVMSRENAIEYPAKLSFFYQSPATAYATTKATHERYSQQVDSSGEGSVTAPITFLDSDEPAQIAAKLHKVMWTEAEGSFDWTVGPHCIDLVPTDVVGLSLRGIVSRARIMSTGFDGQSVKISIMKDRQSSYTSNVTGIPLPLPTPPQPTTMSKAVLAVLDIPALQDSDDQLCYYTAVSGSTDVWRGAQLQRSLDGGSTWTPIGEVTTDVTMGRLTAAMTAASSAYTDTTNTVAVQLFDNANELVSFSDTTFLQEQGAIAVQLVDGTWEVMQYRDAVDAGGGLYTLSYLQRGRLNTAAAAHSVGALFVLLADGVVKNAAQTAWLGGVVKHRAVSYNTSAEAADVVTLTYAGRSQIEWSPASASAEYDGTYVYIHDIVPRHRFGTEVAPVASVNFEGFRVTITDATHTVTADVIGDSAHIVSAPITTPTGVTVAALNKLTGPGDALSVVATSAAAGSLTPVAIVNGGGA